MQGLEEGLNLLWCGFRIGWLAGAKAGILFAEEIVSATNYYQLIVKIPI